MLLTMRRRICIFMKSASNNTLALAAMLVCLPHLYGQGSASIAARFNGNRNSAQGKCTFEVVVDGVAEVRVQGSNGTLRTLSGRPATWRRLDCNMPLPANPRNFRFQGVDGRGRQILARRPNDNRGAAVVRIEDPKGGQEGYTGDLIWDNGGYGPGGPGRPGGPGYPGGPANRDPLVSCQTEAGRRFRVDIRNIRVRLRERRGTQSIVDFQLRDRTGTRTGWCAVAPSGAIVSFQSK
jgi:hypothetical protein